MTDKTLKTLLPDDYSQVVEELAGFQTYSLAEQMNQSMDAHKFSSASLGKRCCVSHTVIDKWRSGREKPNGKEHLKILGMALGYNEEELNSLLLKNGYPALYIKNPYDCAARLLLAKYQGKSDIVVQYKELVKRLGLSDLTVFSYGMRPLSGPMDEDFRQAMQATHVSHWFEKNMQNFVCDKKTQLSSQQLSEFISLYLSESSINEMVITRELPAAIKNLLYPVLNEGAVAVRHLRDKLIAFGLYTNMTEGEINVMLECMKLRLLSEPETKTEMAILCALRNAHQRYPYFEYENVQKAIPRLRSFPISVEMSEQYNQRMELLSGLVSYYDRAKKNSDDIAFEESYTSLSDHGIREYIHDILSLLLEDNIIEITEAEPYIRLLEGKNQED